MKRSNRTRVGIAVITALTLAVSMPALAQTSPARIPEGTWQGLLQGMLRLVVHIERGADGRLTGTLDSPDQGAMGLTIDSLAVTSDSLHLSMSRLMASYVGRFTASRDSITGEWRQGGFNLPLNLKFAAKGVERNRPQEPKKPYPYAEDTVRVENRAGNVSLGGTLTTPKGAGPFPCVVLITGSGPEDRDEMIFGHRPFLVLADHLTRRGIAVLRLDDRGVGSSSGRYSTATSEDFASDVLAAITFLKSRPRMDAKRIGLIGHSEGGLIAPMVAKRSKDVAFVVMLAGPGVPGDSIIILQSAAMRRMTGSSEEFIARETEARRRVHALVQAGTDSTALMPAVRALIEVQTAELDPDSRQAVGDPDSLAWGATRMFSSPWLRFFLTYDPRPTLQALKIPVLAINGSKDFQVPPKENLAAIDAALRAGGNRTYTVKELPGLNHLFQTAATGSLGEYSTIEETMAPVALHTVSEWITARTTTPR